MKAVVVIGDTVSESGRKTIANRDFLPTEAKSTALTSQITLTITEDEQHLAAYLNEPGKELFLFLKITFEEMREMGFAEFSKMLGEGLIFGHPALSELFEDDIRASEGETDKGDVPAPSVDELEQALFSALESRRRKVAMIVMMATDRYPGFRSGSDYDAKVDEALSRLAARDDVLSFGDVKEWRHSEMCRRTLEGKG